MRKAIKFIYDSIRLNLGIKRFLEDYSERSVAALDHLIYPGYQFLGRYFTTRLFYHYGADYRFGDELSQNINKKTSNPGYGLIHYAFIRNQRPKRVLCVGSMYGFIPYMMARACQDNDFGHVDFVDPAYDFRDGKKSFYGIGFWKQTNAKKHFSYLLDNTRVTYYKMASADFAKRYKQSYDYIYFDSDQSLANALRDLKTFWPRLKVNGYLSLFEVTLAEKVERFSHDYPKVWKLFTGSKIDFPSSHSGLGIIQKKNTKFPISLTKVRLTRTKK